MISFLKNIFISAVHIEILVEENTEHILANRNCILLDLIEGLQLVFDAIVE